MGQAEAGGGLVGTGAAGLAELQPDSELGHPA